MNQLPKRAIVKPSHIKQAKLLYKKLPDCKNWFIVQKGKRPVIVTAPHAAPIWRYGKWFADRGTGPLAILLHQMCDVTVIYTTSSPPCDPNANNQNAFKVALENLIMTEKPLLVIDLHQAHHSRPFDIDFGTMNGKSIKSKILKEIMNFLRKEGMQNFSKDYFSAEKNLTITKWAFQRKVQAVQLEINEVWLDLEGDTIASHRFAQVLQGLACYCNSFEK